jgi:hypothetical protein
MTTTMATTAPNASETKADQDDRVTAITDDVVELGTLWARYGLTVGRSALETSARTLAATASLLGHLAEAFEPKKSEPTAK